MESPKAEMNFGRQLRPVDLVIMNGDREDREYWARKINGFLQNQPCVTTRGTNDHEEIICIRPDANND